MVPSPGRHQSIIIYICRFTYTIFKDLKNNINKDIKCVAREMSNITPITGHPCLYFQLSMHRTLGFNHIELWVPNIIKEHEHGGESINIIKPVSCCKLGMYLNPLLRTKILPSLLQHPGITVGIMVNCKPFKLQ